MSDVQSHHLLIADDHPLFRGALREAVTGVFGPADIAEAGTFEANEEVDELLWLALPEAGQLLSYERDRELLAVLAAADQVEPLV